MSGITRIQQTREDFRKPQQQERGKEIWLKDGDQVFCTSTATGAEDDTMMDDIDLYVFRVGTKWTNLIKDVSVDSTGVPDDTRASHKFAFWSYVHFIFHNEKRNDDWEEVETPAGVRMFKETIDDYRIIQLGFGRGDYVWNQMVEIYNDWGSLNKGVLRIKRTGSGAFDTSYSVIATTKKEKIPAARKTEIKDLQIIKEYYFERYGTPLSEEDIELIKIHNTANGNSPEQSLY